MGSLLALDKSFVSLYGLFQAFDVVERSFLESIDDALAEKASLQSQLPEVK